MPCLNLTPHPNINALSVPQQSLNLLLREGILTRLKRINPATLREKYKWLSELGIFGSYVRGEQNEESDVDVLIDYTEAPLSSDRFHRYKT